MAQLQETRTWLDQQRHLPDISDDKLRTFLHSCFDNVPKTKILIEKYYNLKSTAPEFFSQRDPTSDEMRKIQRVIQVVPLPKKTPKGYRVIFGKAIDPDPSHFDLNAAIKHLFMVIDSVLKGEGSSVDGLVFIYDMTGVSFAHIARINLASVRKYFVYIQEAIPARVKGIHVIHVNPVINAIMMLIKPFMATEHLKILHFHSGLTDEFAKYVPLELMPSDLSGDQSSSNVLHDETIKSLENCSAWFKKEEEEKIDETKRSTNNNNQSSYGIEGSFKKLDID